MAMAGTKKSSSLQLPVVSLTPVSRLISATLSLFLKGTGKQCALVKIALFESLAKTVVEAKRIMVVVRQSSTLQILLPVVACLSGIHTIVMVYILTKKSGHLPMGAVTPPISLLGCNPPEHAAYQIGFTLTGILWFAAIEQWRHTFYTQLGEFGPWTRFAMLVAGYVAAVGVVGQGIVTLEENLLENLNEGLALSRQSILHQQLAGLFFLGSAVHCYATTYYILATTWAGFQVSSKSKTISKGKGPATKGNGNSKSPMESATTSCCYGKLSIRLKLFCVVTSLLAWPIAEGLHPARTTSLDKRNLNIAGLAQYIAVISYVFFFGSYTLDFASTTISKEESNDQEKSTKQA